MKLEIVLLNQICVPKLKRFSEIKLVEYLFIKENMLKIMDSYIKVT